MSLLGNVMGEQLVLERLRALQDPRANIVTNDLHFSGSLHNLIGWRKAGRDVRIVRARDWLVALRSPAPRGPLRAWLSTMVSLV